jgi:hypothetical protein
MIPTLLHYRRYQKKSGCKHFITRLHIKKKEPEMFTANKIYGKYRTGNDFFPDSKKKMKSAKIRAERRFRRTRHQFGVT